MTTNIPFGDWLQRAFNLYKQNFAVLVLASLVAMLISMVSCGILAGPMMAGLLLITLRLLRGQDPKPTVGTLFEGFNFFLQSFLFVLVWGLILIGGSLILNFIPCLGQLASTAGSVALSALLMFAMFFIVDRGLAFWPASLASVNTVKTAFWPLLGYCLVASLIGQLGVVLCGIGVIFTMPIGTCAIAVAYDGVVNAPAVEPSPTVEPPVTPPSA